MCHDELAQNESSESKRTVRGGEGTHKGQETIHSLDGVRGQVGEVPIPEHRGPEVTCATARVGCQMHAHGNVIKVEGEYRRSTCASSWS